MERVFEKYRMPPGLTTDEQLTFLERQRHTLLRKLNHVFGNPEKEIELSSELDALESVMHHLEKEGGKQLSLDDVDLTVRELSQSEVSFQQETMEEDEKIQIEELKKIRKLQAEVMADGGKNPEISLQGIYEIAMFYERKKKYALSEIWLAYGAQWYPDDKTFTELLFYLYALHKDGVPDTQKQFYWTKKAAKAGNKDACLELGKHYFKKGTAQFSLKDAAYYFAKAADSRHPDAYIHAFTAFYKIKDYKRAETCLLAADKTGVRGAAYRLALIYDVDENPEGKRNIRKALFWYEKAYRQEADGDVCFGLGNIYEELGRHQEAVTVLTRGVREFQSEDCAESMKGILQKYEVNENGKSRK